VLGLEEIAFIERRDSFYLASQGENGWPYIQHRGGPRGFLRTIDPHTLAFADFSGNKQFITTGNIGHNDRVTLFLMDYPHQSRLKILGHASIIEKGTEPQLEERVLVKDYPGKLERIFKIAVVAFDWNCQQHIRPRFTIDELLEFIEPNGEVGDSATKLR
jgi:predicted pyridoxine 5'-phosphate oxidase superfamily flavin-nucleotide-binding protein